MPLIVSSLTCSVLYISFICLPPSSVWFSWCKTLCGKWRLELIHVYCFLSLAGIRAEAAQPDGHQPHAGLRPLTCEQLRCSSAYASGTHTLCHSFPAASTRVSAHALLRAEYKSKRELRGEALLNVLLHLLLQQERRNICCRICCCFSPT